MILADRQRAIGLNGYDQLIHRIEAIGQRPAVKRHLPSDRLPEILSMCVTIQPKLQAL
jgi:hypothetical protein